MKAKVVKIISEVKFKIDKRWKHHNSKGNLVKIAGLLSSRRKQSRPQNIKQLQNLIEGKNIEIVEHICFSGDALLAVVKINNKELQSYFENDRTIPIVRASRWEHPSENRVISKVHGGVINKWTNPLKNPNEKKAPYLGNFYFPRKSWGRHYEEEMKLAERLYTNNYHNKDELELWFKAFFNNPRRDAPFLVIGDVGIGKSWLIGHKLHNLPKDKFHTFVFDLRMRLRGQELTQYLEEEFNEFLNHHVMDLSWLYSDFKGIYGNDFDPEKPEMRRILQNEALTLQNNIHLKNRKRLRYYDNKNNPELIIAFDNIDHYAIEEQEVVLDLCRGLLRDQGGIRAIFCIRPTTITLKQRITVFFADATPKALHMTSPCIHSMLQKRLATNSRGEIWDLNDNIPNSSITYNQLLQIYEKSDYPWGLAGLVRELCSATNLAYKVPALTNPKIIDVSKSHLTKKYDCRHYLKLFRRILRADALGNFKNIANQYYGIHTLMLRGEDEMTEEESYLFNLFDNEFPAERGNALIRYRVLEYSLLFNDLAELFDVYFRALGYNPDEARRILGLFEECGLVSIQCVQNGSGVKKLIRAHITNPGFRHLEIITNLWYIICIKTGMNIFEDYILYGEEAKKAAADVIDSKELLEHYANNGWVHEAKLIDYLGYQVSLEDHRFDEFCKNSSSGYDEQVKNMHDVLANPAEIIYYHYKEQLNNWGAWKTR